jgi:hypothetical protein
MSHKYIVISGNSYTEKEHSKTSDNIFIKNDRLQKDNKNLKLEIQRLQQKNLFMLSETINLIEKISLTDTKIDKMNPIISEEKATLITLKMAAKELVISLKD